MSFSALPEDVVEYILMLVSPYGELQSCRAVCRQWRRRCGRADPMSRRSRPRCVVARANVAKVGAACRGRMSGM